MYAEEAAAATAAAASAATAAADAAPPPPPPMSIEVLFDSKTRQGVTLLENIRPFQLNVISFCPRPLTQSVRTAVSLLLRDARVEWLMRT